MIVPVPPLGAKKDTLTSVVLDTVVVPMVGEFGFVVTTLDMFDPTDVPPELVAVTENVYNVFGVNPDMVIGEEVPVSISPKLLVTI